MTRKCGTCKGWGRVPSLTELITEEAEAQEASSVQPAHQSSTEQCPDCLGSGNDYDGGGRHVKGSKRGAYVEY